MVVAKAGRQLNALFRHVADEMGSIRHVSEVDVRSDITHPLRKTRCRIHGERQRVALAHRDVHKLEVALLPQIRQLGRGIKRRPDDGDRMGEELDPSLPCGRSPCRLRLSRSRLRIGQESAADVVGDIAVECFAGSIEPQLPDG